MSRYPTLVAAIQARRSVKREILVQLDFSSGSMFVWTGDRGGALVGYVSAHCIERGIGKP